MNALASPRIRKSLTRLGTVALLAPFVWAVGDGLVEGRQCAVERDVLAATVEGLNECLAEADADHVSVSPPASELLEVETEVEVEAEAAPPVGEGLTLGHFAMVRDGRVILDTTADPRLAYGGIKGEVDFDTESVHAHRQVDWGASPELRSVGESTFVLYSDAGEVCRARLTKPRLEAQIFGDFFALVDYDGDSVLEDMLDGGAFEDAQNGKKTQRRRWMEQLLRERVMDEADNWLTAELEPVTGDCEDAMWGRMAKLDAPMIFARDTGDQADEQMRERFRGTEAHARSRAAFDEEFAPNEPGATWTAHEAETLAVERWVAERGTELVLAEVGYAGECGEPDTYETGAWLGTREIADGYIGSADAVFALDGEVYALRSLGPWDSMTLTRVGEVIETVMSANIDFYGCNC